MHQSAFDHMRDCVHSYMNKTTRYRVLDYGSRVVSKQVLRHKDLLEGYDFEYKGVDIVDGDNVDIVMKSAYSIPVENNSIDVIFCGQVLHHLPFFWVSFLEMTRILKKGGFIFLTSPSRGHAHSSSDDFWRFYPDGYKALAAFANLKMVEYHSDFPPSLPNGRFDYSAVPNSQYWGDTVGVFQKTEAHNEESLARVRLPLVDWANANSDVDSILAQFGTLPQSVAPPKTVTHTAFGIKFLDRPDLINAKVRAKMDAGAYEIREANAALKYLKGGERIVELGAGLGFMSTLIKSRMNPASYIAIEGDPRLIPYIRETHRLNKVSGVLIQNCIATSDSDTLARGYCEFKIAKTFWGSSIKNVATGAKTVRVDAIPLVSFIETISADVVIADIEGGEADLFNDIEMPSVNLVILEMHPSVIGEDGVQRVFAELTRAGLSMIEYVDERVVVFRRDASSKRPG